MPSAYAKLRISVNGGAWQTGGVIAAAGDVIRLSGENASYWDHGVFEIYDAPPGWTAPVGWTYESTSGKYVFYSVGGELPPDITLGSEWGKWLVRLVVNDGKKNNIVDDTLTDESTAWCVLSTSGFSGLGNGESSQFAASWAKVIDAHLRLLDGVVGGPVVDDDTMFEPLVRSAEYAGGLVGADGSGGAFTLDWDADLNTPAGYPVELLSLNTRIYTSYAVTLPSPVFNPLYPLISGRPPIGYRATIVDSGGLASAHPITITGASGATINGAASYVIDQDFGFVQLVYLGSSGPANTQYWHIVASGKPISTSSSYDEVQADGTPVTHRTKLDFKPQFSPVDDAANSRTVVSLVGASRRPSYSNVVHWWKLNDASAPFLNSGSSSLQLKNLGASGTVAAHQRGTLDYCIYTQASSGSTRNTEYSDLPGAADQVTGTALTFSMWICIGRNVAASQTIACKAYDSNIANHSSTKPATMQMIIDSSGQPAFGLITGTNNIASASETSGALTKYRWWYLAGTYDGANMRFYINGMLVQTTALTGSIDNGASNGAGGNGGVWAVGGYASTNTGANIRNFDGLIAELLVRNTAVTADTLRDEFLQVNGLLTSGVAWL